MDRQVAVLYSEFEQINRGELGEEGEVWYKLEEVEASYIGCAQGHVGVKSVGRGDVEGGRGARCRSPHQILVGGSSYLFPILVQPNFLKLHLVRGVHPKLVRGRTK